MKPIVHSSEIVHENPWYRIRRDDLTWPNGKPGQYFVCEVPPGAAVICEQDGKLLTIKQYRHPIGQDSIEFPVGRTDDQDPETAARRELHEETGYEVESLIPIGKTDNLSGLASAVIHLFVGTNPRQAGSQELDDSESDMTVQWIPIPDWKRMIANGEITNAYALSAWAIYEQWKAEHL